MFDSLSTITDMLLDVPLAKALFSEIDHLLGIKTHGSVSAAKEVVWHTSVLSRHTVVCQRPRKSCGTHQDTR